MLCAAMCFIIYLLLTFFVACHAIKIPYNHINQNYSTVSNNDLAKIFAYSFESNYCGQMIFEPSPYAFALLKLIHETATSPTLVVYDIQDSKPFCPYQIIFTKSLQALSYTLNKIKFFGRTKILCLVADSNDNDLQIFIKEGAIKHFGQESSLLFLLSEPKFVYRFSFIANTFIKERIGDPKWISDVVRFEDLNGVELTVSTFNCSIYSKIGPLDSKGKPKWFSGVEMEFFHLLSEKLNFSYRIIVPNDEDKRGYIDENGMWSGGILKLVGERKVDIAFCGVLLTDYLKMSLIEATPAITKLCHKFLVPRPILLTNQVFGIFKPFRTHLWAFIIATTIFMALCFRWVADITKEIPTIISSQNSIYRKYPKSLFIVWAILFGNFPKSSASKGPLRHIVTWWALFCMLMSACFASSLISHLTNPAYSHELNTLSELIENKFIWSTNTMIDFKGIFNMDDKWQKEWIKRYFISSADEENQLIKQNAKLAIFGEQLDDAFYVYDDICASCLRSYQVSSECISSLTTGLILPSGSPYTNIFTYYVNIFQERGIFIKEFRDASNKEALHKQYIREVVQAKRLKMMIWRKKLELDNIIGVFYAYALGIVISLIVFVIELALPKIINTELNFNDLA